MSSYPAQLRIHVLTTNVNTEWSSRKIELPEWNIGVASNTKAKVIQIYQVDYNVLNDYAVNCILTSKDYSDVDTTQITPQEAFVAGTTISAYAGNGRGAAEDNLTTFKRSVLYPSNEIYLACNPTGNNNVNVVATITYSIQNVGIAEFVGMMKQFFGFAG